MKNIKLSNEELLEMMYNDEINYNNVEKQNRRNKRRKKGYKYN